MHGGPWDRPVWHRIILRFVRHLVNDTKTNQFIFSTLLLIAIGHPWHACKLRSIFSMKISFLGSSIFGSIHQIILDFPMIFVVSYTCVITLQLMYNGLLQIHPTHKLWYQMWARSVRVGTLRRCLNVPQNCLKVPQVCLKVPRKCLKVPPLFSGTYFTATYNVIQLQALCTGICSIQILILVIWAKPATSRLFHKLHLKKSTRGPTHYTYFCNFIFKYRNYFFLS